MLTRAEVLFLAVGAAMAAIVVWFNWRAEGMQGLLAFYEDFSDVIRAGFDPNAAVREHAPTFPMWGYGWILLVTHSKIAILTAQELLALVTSLVWIRHVARIGGELIVVQGLRALVLVSIPWFAMHALLWPYSPSVCLIALSVVLAHRGFLFGPIDRRRIVASGLLLGLALNFRSDPILLPVALAAGILLLRSPRRRALAPLALWFVSIYVCLVPWMLYTKHVTGHVLLTSTNGGGNLFEGLGMLPGNKWGITFDDSDPLMHRIVQSELGPRPSLYVQYDADQLLKREFLARVRSDPREYARKCLHNLSLILESGCYLGEFENAPEPSVIKNKLSELTWPIAHDVVKGSLLLLPLTLLVAWRRRHGFFLLVGLAIAYQTALNVVGGFLPSYSSLVLFFHMTNLVYGASVVVGFFWREPARPRATPVSKPSSPPGLAPAEVELSILLPVRNEGANLAVMLDALRAVVDAEHEAIVICDDRADTSIPVVEAARAKYPGARLVLNERGRGVLNAIAAGVAAARGRYVLVFAADEVGPVLAIADMLALAREGCDFVSVTRYAHGGRRLGGSRVGGALSRIANALFRLGGGALTDSTTGIKMFRRSIFESLQLDSSVGWSVAFQMAIKAQLAGLVLGEVPVVSIDRLYGGQSTFRVGAWTKQYLRLFLWGLARGRELRRVARARVRVRVPVNVSSSLKPAEA